LGGGEALAIVEWTVCVANCEACNILSA
jgi:hypothetical protein